jgi:hypothetical protein
VPSLFTGSLEEQGHPVTKELPSIVLIKGLNITAGELSLEHGVARVSSDAGSHHKSVPRKTPDTFLEQTADSSTPVLRRDLIESIEEETTATGFEEIF